MVEQKLYNLNEVCDILGVTFYTVNNWYKWERKVLLENPEHETKLPTPIQYQDKQGKPRYWTEEMVSDLKNFKENIVMGRNGVYGKYTNPLHNEEEKNNE